MEFLRKILFDDRFVLLDDGGALGTVIFCRRVDAKIGIFRVERSAILDRVQQREHSPSL